MRSSIKMICRECKAVFKAPIGERKKCPECGSARADDKRVNKNRKTKPLGSTLHVEQNRKRAEYLRNVYSLTDDEIRTLMFDKKAPKEAVEAIKAKLLNRRAEMRRKAKN